MVADQVAHDRLADVQPEVVDTLDNFALLDIDMRSAVDDKQQHAVAVDSCLVVVDRNSLVAVELHFDHTSLATMQPLEELPMAVTFVKSVTDFAFDNWLEYVHL